MYVTWEATLVKFIYHSQKQSSWKLGFVIAGMSQGLAFVLKLLMIINLCQ